MGSKYPLVRDKCAGSVIVQVRWNKKMLYRNVHTQGKPGIDVLGQARQFCGFGTAKNCWSYVKNVGLRPGALSEDQASEPSISVGDTPVKKLVFKVII
jgi:hypothetical protein